MKRVLGYLKYRQHYPLHDNKYPVVIEGYSDANWITGSNDVKSTSGLCIHTWWRSCLLEIFQTDMYCRSTMESEFIALDKAGEEAE